MIYFSHSYKYQQGKPLVSSIYLTDDSGNGIVLNSEGQYEPLTLKFPLETLKHLELLESNVYYAPVRQFNDDDLMSLAQHLKKYATGEVDQEKLHQVLNVFGEEL